MSGRPTVSQLRQQGRMAERADVIGQIDAIIAGARAIAARQAGAGVDPGIDLSLYIGRLEALKGTIMAGCHVGLGVPG